MPGPVRGLLLAMIVLIAGVVPAPAQTYPNRPIRLVVGFPPGGAVDIIARIYAQGLSARLGQAVVVENKPGTGGNLASDTVAKAAPDGYTLLHGTENVFISNPHVYGADAVRSVQGGGAGDEPGLEPDRADGESVVAGEQPARVR